MTTVVCVLRTGGDFTEEYVYRLKAGVDANMSDHKFMCLTDLDHIDGVWTVPLTTAWPGWWSKIELFKLPATEKYLYFDLDTIVKGNIQDIADYPHRFTMINDVGRYERPMSGMMAWQGDYRYLFEWFTGDLIPQYTDHKLGSQGGPWGDGGYIASNLNHEPEIFQRLFPNRIVSYKWQNPQERLAASVVCYHGPPRPHQTGWAI